MGLAMKLHMMAAVVLCLTAVSAHKLTTFTGTYGPSIFNPSCSDIFKFQGGAYLAPQDSLQLTQPEHPNQAGRVTLNKPFKLWEKQGYNRVASFNTSFLFQIEPLYHDIQGMGEGLAFIISPNMSVPPKSDGEYLGLTNNDTDGNPDNQFVAVELDNVKEYFDPDANHVGINVNSIISEVNASLTPWKIELGITGFINVWIQYDGVKKVIEVYIAPAEVYRQPAGGNISWINTSQPDTPVLRSSLHLSEVLSKYSYFGFSGSNGNGKQYNGIYWWNLTVDSYTEDVVPPPSAPVPPPSAPVLPPLASVPPTLAIAPQDQHTSWKKSTVLTVGVGVGVLLLVMGAAVTGYCYPCQKRLMAQSKSNVLLGVLKRLPGTPREFQFKDLKKATNNFNDKNVMGQGGFGVVYRGHLQNENLEVAVKWFSREAIKGQDDFLAELTIINRLRHKHLVRLLGWSHKQGKLLLVYDYMPNGSLDAHLFPKTQSNKPLSWDLRYKIISGVASALHYLHNEYDQKIVHRDIKASNIMLDSDFNARLGDFGLARTLDKEKNSYTEAGVVVGTLGYIAPECFHTGKATQQSDIYAFGVVLLEIVCGLRMGTIKDEFDYLVDWVWSLHHEGRILDAVEEQLRDEYVVEEAQKMLILALACCQPIASERPRTQGIVQIISGLAPVPYVPPFKPAFVWPMPSVVEDDISSLASPAERTSFRMNYSVSGYLECISREESSVSLTD